MPELTTRLAPYPPGPSRARLLVSNLDEHRARDILMHWLERTPHTRRASRLAVKRLFDIVIAAGLLILSAPILLLAMAAIRLSDPGPATFVQQRIGFRCRRFNMYKLRTMRNDSAVPAEALAGESVFLKLRGDPRVTPVGQFLRRTSIDELPQLINVLRGDMSLVGPRPLLISDFRKFPKDKQLLRFAMPPGLTGLWQVNGRSETSDEFRIQLDLHYVERFSLWADLVILAKTVPTVLFCRGAS